MVFMYPVAKTSAKHVNASIVTYSIILYTHLPPISMSENNISAFDETWTERNNRPTALCSTLMADCCQLFIYSKKFSFCQGLVRFVECKVNAPLDKVRRNEYNENTKGYCDKRLQPPKNLIEE